MAEVLGALDAAAVAAIRSTTEAGVQACLASQWDKWVQNFDAQAIMIPPNVDPVESPPKIRAFVEAFPKITVLRLIPSEIDGRADLAFVRGHYELTAGGESDRGSYLELWRKQNDGSWKIFRTIWNSDLPAQTG